jgi:NADH-quinone oxidoreductase subunit G
MLLFDVEPEEDGADPQAFAQALQQAEFIVSFSPFVNSAEGHADVMLPISPFTETAGSLINAEGRLQQFNPVVQPLAETRPGWKVLRVLGNLLGLAGFDYQSIAEVRAEAFGSFGGAEQIATRLAQQTVLPLPKIDACAPAQAIERLATVPIYSSDAIVRRASSLQRTRDARQARMVGVSAALWQQLGLCSGDAVRLSSTAGDQAVVLPAYCDDTLAENVVRVAAAWAEAAPLGAMFGTLRIERVASSAQPSAATPAVEKV